MCVCMSVVYKSGIADYAKYRKCTHKLCVCATNKETTAYHKIQNQWYQLKHKSANKTPLFSSQHRRSTEHHTFISCLLEIQWHSEYWTYDHFSSNFGQKKKKQHLEPIKCNSEENLNMKLHKSPIWNRYENVEKLNFIWNTALCIAQCVHQVFGFHASLSRLNNTRSDYL